MYICSVLQDWEKQMCVNKGICTFSEGKQTQLFEDIAGVAMVDTINKKEGFSG